MTMVAAARSAAFASIAFAVGTDGGHPSVYVDYRGQTPGAVHKITPADLPKPFVTESAVNQAHVVPRPENAWPSAPPGFKVELYASRLESPRLIRTAPNGDLFVAESRPGRIKVFRGIRSAGEAEQSAVFATGLREPFGIAFYPLGPEPQYVYVANTNSVFADKVNKPLTLGRERIAPRAHRAL